MLLTQTAMIRKSMNKRQVLLAGRENPQAFALGLLNISLWKEQIDYINNSVGMFNVLSAGRRWGKTTGGAVKGLWYGFYRRRPRFHGDPTKRGLMFKEYKILVGSRTQAQANKIMKEAQKLVQDKDSLLHDYYVRLDNSQNFPILMVRSANGEVFEIHARSFRDVDNLQGFNYDLVIVDEAVRVPKLATDVFTTIMPMIGDTAGMIDFVSSPTLMLGDFYQFHLRADPDSKRFSPDWTSTYGDSRNNPYNDATTFLKLAAQYPTKEIADIFLGGRFPTIGLGMFNVTDVVEMFTKDQFDSGLVLDGDYQPFTYDKWSGSPQGLLHCADIAKKKDFTVVYTLDLNHYSTSGKIPIIGFQRFHGLNYPDITTKILMQQDHFGGGRISLDATGVGESVADGIDAKLGENFCERIYFGSNKEDILINLQKYIQAYTFQGPEIPCLEEELISYTLPDTNLMTDCVMALAVGAWSAEHGPEIGQGHIKRGKTLSSGDVEILSRMSGARQKRSWDL